MGVGGLEDSEFCKKYGCGWVLPPLKSKSLVDAYGLPFDPRGWVNVKGKSMLNKNLYGRPLPPVAVKHTKG